MVRLHRVRLHCSRSLLLCSPSGAASAAEQPALAKARAALQRRRLRRRHQRGRRCAAASPQCGGRRRAGHRPLPSRALPAARSTRPIWPPRATRCRPCASSALTPRDQVDLLVGLGQSLYLGETFGAAAELFDTALEPAPTLLPRARSAAAARLVGHRARSRGADARRPNAARRVFERIARAHGGGAARGSGASRVANYWLAVAARGSGDVDRAWDAAVAAWVRSTLTRSRRNAARRPRSPRHAGPDPRARPHAAGPRAARLHGRAARRMGSRQAAVEVKRAG